MKLASCSILFLAPPTAAFMMPRDAARSNQAVTNVAVLDTPSVTEANNQKTRDLYDPLGLYPPSSEERRDGRIQVVSDSYIEVIDELNRQRPINDPLGLYPPSSKERRDYRIQVVQSGEEEGDPRQTITDPLNLYPSNVVAVKDQLQQAMNQRPLHDPFALYGPSSPERQEGRIEFATDAADTTFLQEWNRERPLYDPLTLYPESSDERRNNRIEVLESEDDLATIVARSQAVVDPLQLYPKSDSAVVRDSSLQADMSRALPFMSRPILLDGTLAGDAGFDPLGLASNKEKLVFLRDAELKHSRIAMLVRIHSVKGAIPLDESSTPKIGENLTVFYCHFVLVSALFFPICKGRSRLASFRIGEQISGIHDTPPNPPWRWGSCSQRSKWRSRQGLSLVLGGGTRHGKCN
jgi:hypothetical protein